MATQAVHVRSVCLFLNYENLASDLSEGHLSFDALAGGFFYLDVDHHQLRHAPLPLRRILRLARKEGRLLWKSNGVQHTDDFNALLRQNGLPPINANQDAVTSFAIGGGWIDLHTVMEAIQRQLAHVEAFGIRLLLHRPKLFAYAN